MIQGEEYSTIKSGNDILIALGEDTITLSYAANLSAVNITSSVQDIHPIYFVENYSVNDTLISGTAYRDSINNYGSNVSINTADGSDTVINDGDNVYITTGDGFDYIYNDGSNSTIDAGAGDDYINAVASFVISGDGKVQAEHSTAGQEMIRF